MIELNPAIKHACGLILSECFVIAGCTLGGASDTATVWAVIAAVVLYAAIAKHDYGSSNTWR